MRVLPLLYYELSDKYNGLAYLLVTQLLCSGFFNLNTTFVQGAHGEKATRDWQLENAWF